MSLEIQKTYFDTLLTLKNITSFTLKFNCDNWIIGKYG